MKRTILRKIMTGFMLATGFTLAAGLNFAILSCANISNSASDCDNVSSIKYGSITLTSGADSRALDVNTLTSATVTVSGCGMKDVEVKDVALTGGAGSCTIDKVPVGDNRVVTVKSNVDGAVIRAVTDIKAGNNVVTVNWETTARASVFYYLINEGKDVSAIAKTAFDSAIDSTVHAALIDSEAIAKDYPNLKESSSYISDYGTVKVSTSNVSGYTIQITDIASEKKLISDEEDSFELKAYPGTWKTLVFDAGGTKVAEEEIFVRAGKESCVDLKYEETGIEILVEKALNYPKIHYWNCSDSVAYKNTSWPGIDMDSTANDTYYVFNFAGCDSVKLLITNASGGKLCSSDIEITSKGRYTITGNGSEKTGNSEPKLTLSVKSATPPVEPTLEISPATGSEIGTSSSIKITASFGNDEPTVNKVTINGTEKTLSEGVNTYPVSDFETEGGKKITVTGTLTNSKGTATVSATYTTKVTKEDPFTWDNVNAYFVLTDRFANGDSTNDHSYYRKNGLNGDENVATFHGGDIKGLTDNLDYFEKLGVNAIWITAPYEQAHGWVGGKDNKFPHYAFHGYYTLDWTSMDANMGTVEELRTFVNACHSKGIRVIMDVVMNHVGYNNNEDMYTYSYGTCKHPSNGWFEKTDGLWNANAGIGDNDWKNNDAWAKWFGPWIRSFGYASGSEYGGSCGGLPDVKTELKNSVGMAPVLTTKWGLDGDEVKSKYWNPSVAKADWNGYSGDYRTDKNIAPADYQVVWLSAWVRELGIDGFRCDTAKHVEPFRWGELKTACTDALKKWRADATKDKTYNDVDTGAADWDESFWMTGECWGWKDISATGGDYYGTGKFDSMINFSFNPDNSWDGNYRTNYPKADSWGSYLSINSKADTDGNGNRDNVLTYISSHDTGLTRVGDQYEVGTGLVLLPGGVQIYYGDESYREKAYLGCGDGDMYTRGDMNLEAAKSSALVKHWGKVGNFRKYNPAVGAGTGTAYKRSYTGAAGDNKVAIGISGTSVDVSGLWEDGTKVYNWYDGSEATVSGGFVTFNGGSMKTPILVSEKNPADYGVSF